MTTSETTPDAATVDTPDTSEGTAVEGNQVNNNNDTQSNLDHDDSNVFEDSASNESTDDENEAIKEAVYIPNELLCYMQNKTQVCTQDFLVQVCCDFYCEDVISEAKALLYKHVKAKGRMIGRRGAQKSLHEMRDIYQVLLEMEPTDNTTFVAHNLSNLPPLSMDNNDTLRLLKEIENVKSDLKCMQIAQADILKIVNIERTSNSINTTTTDEANKDTSMSNLKPQTQPNEDEYEGGRDDKEKEDSSDDDEDDEDDDDDEEIPSAQPQNDRLHLFSSDNEVNIATESKDDSFDIPSAQPQRDHSMYGLLHSPSHTDAHDESDSDCEIVSVYFPNAHHNKESQTHSGQIKTKTFVNQNMWKTKQQKETNKELRIAYSNRQNDRMTLGTAPTTTLKAVTPLPRKQNSSPSGNRSCTGLFVSRLQPHYTPKQVESFVWQQAGEKVRVEKITSRSSQHSSFYIPCDRPVRDALKDSSIWPTGCFIKLYFC